MRKLPKEWEKGSDLAEVWSCSWEKQSFYCLLPSDIYSSHQIYKVISKRWANVRQRLKKGDLPNFGQRVKIVGQTFGADFTAGDQISNYQHNWTQTTSFSCKLSGFCSSAPFCSAVEVNWVQFRWIGLRLNEWLSINCLGDYKHFQNAFHVYFLFSSSILNFWGRHLVCCCLFRQKKIRFAAS